MADLKKLREAKKAYTEVAVSRGNSTSGVYRAGSAAASGGGSTESRNDFLNRLQNETRNLYSQAAGNAGRASASPASTPVSTQPQGSLYAQIAKQLRGTQRPNLYSGTTPQSPAATAPLTQGSQYSQPQPAAMPGLTGAQRQMIAERNNANGPLAASANPNDWSGDAAMYLQAGGDIDRATVRGLDYSQRRFIGDMAGGVRNAVNEAGYLYQSGRESMKDPTKGPNIEEQLLYDFATDPHAMDAYNAWRASLKPGEFEAMEMMGQLPSPGQLYVQQRMREMGEEFQANYEEPELKRITNFGQNFQDQTEKLYGDMTGGWKTAADVAGSIGQQVPAMALRVIPMVGPALSNAYFFGSAAGASTEEAYADGASLQQAVDYGALSGTVEMLTEHVFDGMSGLLGKGAADDAVEGLIHALTRRSGNNALRNGLRWTFGALGEAGEEGISALVDPLLRTVYNNKTVRESYKDLDWEDVWNQVLLGGLSGGVLSSIGLANGQFKGKNAELDARVANEVVNDFLTNTPEGQALAQQAENNLATQNAPQTNQGAENGQTGPYASIETLPDGRQYVKADREVIYGNDPDSWGEQITEYINGKIRNGEDVPVTTVDGDTLLLTADTAGKAAFRNYVYEQEGRQRGRPMTDEEYNAKINAEAHIDELAEVSKMRDRAEPPVPDRGVLHDFAKDGWKYRTVFFRDFDGKYYKITLSTGLNNGAYTVYNVGVMEETPFPNLSGYGTSNGRAGNGASADTVSQTAGNGNTNLQTEGTNNGEQSGHGASENGNDGVRAGEQGTGIPELGEEGAVPGSEGQVRESVSEGRGENLRSVTLQELGVTNAAEGVTIQVQDEQSLTGDAARAAQQARQQGLEPVAFRGEMIVNGASVNGYIENGRVFFRTDAKYRDGTPISSEAIVRHESVHNAKDSDPGIIDIGMEIVRQNRSEAEVLEMMDAYRETYKDLYDFEKMSEEDITDMLVEEIVADAYAGMNYFRDGGETVEQVRTAIGNQVERAQAAERGNENRGPPRAVAAGRNARTADSRSLSRAEEMERNGSANEEIRQETGWYRGMDGQWRFEIDDSGAKYYRYGDAQLQRNNPDYAEYKRLLDKVLSFSDTPSAEEMARLKELDKKFAGESQRLSALINMGSATLDMILDHEELYEAYPQLRKAGVEFADLPEGARGKYVQKGNKITLSNKLIDEPTSTLLHEIQHAIQGIEGFTGGSSPEYWNRGDNYDRAAEKIRQNMQDIYNRMSKEDRALYEEYRAIELEQDALLWEELERGVDNSARSDELEQRSDELYRELYGKDWFGKLLKYERMLDTPAIGITEFYRNTAGEIEARDAANRRDLTAEERKNTPPDLGDENTVFADAAERAQYAEAEMDFDPNSDAQQNWEKQIDKIKKTQTITGEEENIEVRNNTPKVILDHDKTARDLPIRIRYDAAYLATRESGDQPGHYHNLGDLMKQLPAKLENPILILKLDNGRVNCLIEIQDKKGKNILVSVELNQWNTNTGESYNLIVTTFGASKNYLNNLVEKKGAKVLYATEEASHFISGLNNTTGNDLDTSSEEERVSQDKEKSNPQNGPRASAEVNTGAAEEQLQKERREALRAQAAAMTAHRNGRGIDIMPGEGEESISSANGLTEADNADLDARNPAPGDGFDASVLFGPTNTEQEARATEKATKEGNDALARFAEEMPDDPMDLYQEQNPVNARKGGDDGNGPRYQPGYEKMSTEKAAEKKTLGQKISEGWHRLLRSMVNEGDAIHQAGRRTGNRALDGMYFYAKAATQRAQQWIQGQRMNFDLSESGKGLNAIFDPIRAKGDEYYKNFQLYMYHMLNVERMSRSTADALQEAQQRVDELAAVDPSIATMSEEQLRNRARQYQEQGGLGYEDDNRGELIYQYWQALKERDRAERAKNKPVFDYDMDADESRKIARDLLAAHPEFEDLAQDVYDYVDALLQYRVDSGLITAEDMNRLKEMYPHYIPVMYKMAEEEVDDRHRKGNIQTDDAIKKAKGGTKPMEPLHLALARQTLAVMRNSGYQQLGSEVLKEFRNNAEIMGRYVTNVEEADAVWDESMADNDDVNVPYENVISVFQDGKRFDLTLSDDMSYAFQSLQPSRQGNQDWKLMMKGNDLFKKLCTAYNPLFMITNPIRDVQDALFYSTDTKRWLRNYPRAIAQIAGNGRFWQMYQAMGGVNNSYFDWATGENSGKMGRIEALNMAIEQAPRLAEYMTVLENAQRNNGEVTQADRMEAFNAAAEITTNFSRGGTLGKWINRNLVPFWNPGVQGLSKAVRTVTETRGFKAWAGLTMKAAALGMVPALLNGLLYRDDDEWDTIDDQLKMEYYLFKTSDGVWIKVPKGRVLAALSMPVVGAQESMRGDEVDWKELTMQAFGSVAPNNPLETNLLSTAVQAKLFDADDPGKTWYGGDIESRRLQGYAPGERYDESTDILSKWLGKQLNISPKKINYVIDQYSGILGDLVLPYLTPRAERGISAEIAGHDVSVPLSNAFMSRFTLDTVTNNTISGEYYDMLDELGFDAKSGDNPAAIAERYMNRAGSTVSDIYAQIREIENDTELTDREKTQLTRELRKQLNEYEKQVIEDAGKYLTSAREYMDDHPEFDYTDDGAVDAFVEGYNSMQTNEKYFIDAEQAAGKMKDEVYREVNREHFGAEYALQVYNKDVYEKARTVHDDSGLSYEDYYDYYFGTRYLFGDKDAEGNTIAGSRTDKVVNFLEGMDITDEQRNALYHAADHTWNYPTGITEYLKEHPEYDFMDSQAVNAFVEGYNAQQSSEKYYIDAAGAKSKMRSEAYREIYREQYGAEYALEFFDKDVYEKAQELNTSAGLSYDDYYDFYFGTRYMYADKDENGNSISGSKKEKVVGFINDMDVSDAEKDALYLAAGYKENTLKTTPWNGGSGRYSSEGGSGGRGGGSRKAKAPKTKAVKGSGKIQLPKVSSGSGTGAGKAEGLGKGADASLSLIQIIDKYYGGNALAAAMDGGARARGRTKVDFEV